MRRWGGNATSRYNWKNDIGNHAIDWYFENIKESDAANLPDDSSVNRFIAQDRRTGTQTFLTVPMSGWVSNNDANACGYSTAKYNYTPAVNPDGAASIAPDRPNCGNGVTQFSYVPDAGHRVCIDRSTTSRWKFSAVTSKTCAVAVIRLLGWRRVPYIWWGSMLQFGGFAIMPFSLILLSGLAIVFLPRQFQIVVVENVDESHVKRAVWLFPLYLLLINIFVLPLALGGLLHFGGEGVNPDTFVLTLPLLGNHLIIDGTKTGKVNIQGAWNLAKNTPNLT